MLRFAYLFLASCALLAGGITKERLISMVKAGTPEAQIRATVKAEGLDFNPRGSVLAEIRDAGGSLGLTVFLEGFRKEEKEAATATYTQQAPVYEPEVTGRFALSLQAAKPVGEWPYDHTAGYGVGLNWFFNREGLEQRLHIGYTVFGEKDLAGLPPNWKVSSKIDSFLVSWDFMPCLWRHRDQSIHLVIGPGIGAWSQHLTLSEWDPIYSGGVRTETDDNGGISATAIVGIQYRPSTHWLIEVTYKPAFGYSAAEEGLYSEWTQEKFNHVSAMVSYRF